MAGVGFDALMIRRCRPGAQGRGSGEVPTSGRPPGTCASRGSDTRIIVDGTTWFHDDATCVLIGNVGTIIGGVTAFESARPDDGQLDVGVVTARGIGQWSRVWARVITKQPDKSPLVQRTTGTKINIELGHPLPYELDGGARPRTDALKVRIEPGALPVCTPLENTLGDH